MPYDFTEKTAALLKRVAAAGGSLGSGLAKTAVELALREAYEQGKADASGLTAPQVGAASAKGRAESPAVGRAGAATGVLESDVQARCSHYFVQVGRQEVCVACRHVRGGSSRS